MIPTLRRGRDDVFLIGEEDLLLAQDSGRDPDPTIATGGLGGRPSRRPRPRRLPASLRGARGLALLGLAAGAPALLLALRPGGGEGPAPALPTSPPRSPLISRSAAGVPALRTTRLPRPIARPAEVPRRSVVHHRSPRHQAPAPPRPQVTRAEPEREPTPQVAPVSSPAVRRTEAAPEPDPQSAPTAAPTPPDPPPPSSGGGPGGVEDPSSSKDAGPSGVESFGFER